MENSQTIALRMKLSDQQHSANDSESVNQTDVASAEVGLVKTLDEDGGRNLKQENIREFKLRIEEMEEIYQKMEGRRQSTLRRIQDVKAEIKANETLIGLARDCDLISEEGWVKLEETIQEMRDVLPGMEEQLAEVEKDAVELREFRIELEALRKKLGV